MNRTTDDLNLGEIQNPKTLERIDGKYIWREISGVLNFEKGIFYTIKELFLRPGSTVREFILYDRKRLVKPIVFVVLNSLVFTISASLLNFETGTWQEGTATGGVGQVVNWIATNFGFATIILGIFIALWTKLFFLKAPYNIYEILILTFFTVGIVNLLYTISGVIETITGFKSDILTYFITFIYSGWAFGSFFNEGKFLSYVKGFLANLIGATTGSLVFILVGYLIDVIKSIKIG